MSGQFSNFGYPDGNEKQKKSFQEAVVGQESNKQREKDVDLIIEENTIYEIDRECYERLKKQKRRRE